MHRLIHRHLLLPGFETVYKNRKTFRYLTELEQTQWFPADKLGQIQFANLRRLLAHAFAHCDYYRGSWQERGLDPAKVQSPRDFSAWPVIGRAEIRANRERMRGRVPGLKLISKSTGGSSGEPLHFDLDFNSNDRRTAASYRGYGWAGAGPGTKQLYLWGGAVGRLSRAKRVKDTFYHSLHRRKYLSTFGLSDRRFDEYLDVCNRYGPDAIVAYTSSLYEFARMIEERGRRPFSPRTIVVGAEKLYDFQRKVIERVFGAPVFETYGSREFMLTGAECERHQGLHLTQEQLLVEVLNDDGIPTPDGEEGDIVVTDLYNYGMPFVRYRTGDRAVAGWSYCSCGRGLPLLKSVVGRTMDVLITPDGRRVAGAIFPHLLKDFPSVRRFQVIQDTPDHVELRVVATDAWDRGDGDAVGRVIGPALGPMVRFDILRVDEIHLTGAGKLKVVVNNRAGSACGEVSPPTL